LKVQDSSSKPPQSRLIEHLRRKELLLILDNFEQLISPPLAGEEPRGLFGVGLLAELLAECAGLRMLVTSRERLHLRAEQRYRVPPLDLATAVELFVQRATAVDVDFVLTAENRPLVEAICQRLDRLPLAIELCAAQVDLLSLPHLLASLQERPLVVLVGGAHDLPPRQRTLRTAIGHSYRLLPETERTLFRSLGVFVGGFALPEVTAVINGSIDHTAIPQPLLTSLHSLVGKSLVQVETLATGEQRFSLLETIREFALEQACAQGEEAQLRERHYKAYLHLFRTGDGHLRGAEMPTWMVRLEPEQGNFRAAWQWAVDAARYADARWLSFAGAWFYNLRGQWYEQGQWLLQLLPHRHQLPVDLHLDLLVDVYATGRVMDEFQPLDYWKQELLQMMTICTNQHLLTMAWHLIACFAADFSEASPAHERAIAAARRAHSGPALGPEWGLLADCDFQLGSVLWAYALGLIEQGEFTQAIPLLLESRAIFERRGNQSDLADSLATLGFVAFLQGDLVKAHTYLQEAIPRLESREMLGLWQPLLGLVTLYNGNALEARRLLDESLCLCLELKERRWLARICIYLAEVALWEGEIGQAEQALAQSLAYEATPRRMTAYEIIRFWVAARLAAAQQQYQHSATLFGLADQMHSQIHYAIAGPMRSLADAALATVREALEPTIFAETFAAGQQLSLTEAFATLLTAVQVLPQGLAGNTTDMP
jgi:predicted ATPase